MNRGFDPLERLSDAQARFGLYGNLTRFSANDHVVFIKGRGILADWVELFTERCKRRAVDREPGLGLGAHAELGWPSCLVLGAAVGAWLLTAQAARLYRARLVGTLVVEKREVFELML